MNRTLIFWIFVIFLSLVALLLGMTIGHALGEIYSLIIGAGK